MSSCKGLVMLADDADDLRDVVVEIILRDGNHDVLPVRDGLDALRMLRSRYVLPSVIVLDLMMPALSGWSFLEIVRGDERLRNIPIIAVSASPFGEARPLVSSILRKPFRVDELLREIGRVCHRCGRGARRWPPPAAEDALDGLPTKVDARPGAYGRSIDP